MNLFRMGLASRGANILTDDKSEAAFNNKDGDAFASWYDRVVNEDGWVPQSSDEGWNAWNNGEAAWLFDGTCHLVVQWLDFDFGVTKPYFMPGSEQTMASTNSPTLVIPRNPNRSDEKEQQAIELIRLLT